MSRVGKLPIKIPEKVKVAVNNNVVHVEGPLGKLSYIIHVDVNVKVENGEVLVTRANPDAGGMHGLYRAMINNMVNGVSKGFTRELDINGVGYRAEVKGKDISFSLGFSHPVVLPIPEGIKVTIEKQTHITITGYDRQVVGQFAANIRAQKKPEPFKGKGIKYTEEVIRRKAGKAAGAKA